VLNFAIAGEIGAIEKRIGRREESSQPLDCCNGDLWYRKNGSLDWIGNWSD
jgi:hypothetical protein